MKERVIYLLPGRGRKLSEGLGAELCRRGYTLKGHSLESDFGRYSFDEQLAVIQSDLQNEFWHSSSKIIAVSFGAYLFLQAQADMAPYIGQVLLLSPIIGEVINLELGRYFIPPRAEKIKLMSRDGNYPIPKQIEVHIGEEDWQCPLKDMQKIANQWDISLSIVASQSHRLEESYVGNVLDRWLKA